MLLLNVKYIVSVYLQKYNFHESIIKNIVDINH